MQIESQLTIANDLVCEYLIADYLVKQYCRDGHLNRELISAFDLRKEWFPGQVGVFAFLAAILAENGVELWTEINYEFDEKADFINQVAQVIQPAFKTRSFLKELFSSNIERLERVVGLVPEFNTRLLTWLSKDNAERGGERFLLSGLDVDNEEPLKEVLPVPQPPRDLTYRAKFGWDRESLPDKVKPDFDFWHQHVPRQLIPLLSGHDMPLDAKHLLIRIVTRLCIDRRVPVELTSVLYPSFAGAFRQAGGWLPPEEELQILLCDDEPLIRRLLCQYIQDYLKPTGLESSHVVTEVGNGNEALTLALARRFSMLLIDEVHPGMSGTNVAYTFRSQSRTEWKENLSIIMLTGWPSSHDFSPSQGLDGYLSKPFRSEEFFTRVVPF